MEPQTYNFALENLKINKKNISNKITLFNCGLSSENKEIQTLYLPNRDGISTYNVDWLNEYAPKSIQKSMLINCKIEKASEKLKQLIEENSINNIIFKIDVEGAEYEIMQDLAINYPDIFNKIEILVGDTHCGFEPFLKIITPFDFKIIEACPSEKGTCSFIMVRKQN